jgi:beta-xylosidase
MKTVLNCILVGLFALYGCQSVEKNTEGQSSVAQSGNPLFEGWYADPEVAVFGDTYWIFPTYSNRFEKQVFFDAFSSQNLVDWQKHERILDTAAVSWAEKAMWAPCAVEKDGQYFLFFGANDLQTPESRWWNPQIHSLDDVGGIGVAVSDRPEGPYQDYLGKPLIGEVYNGAQPIDQFVFEDEGEYYIIYGGWGHCNIAKLTEDFRSLKPFADGEMVMEITPEGYVEGPVMFKRAGWYYLMWSEGNWTDGSYQVAYGRARSVTGPFPKMGIVLQNDPEIATGAGHHSVLQLPDTDDWYVVYHRRPIPNEDRDHRVTCIDRMEFDGDGKIMPIIMTNDGVSAHSL